MEISISESAQFAELLKLINEKNPLVNTKPFVNLKGKVIYNPADKERRTKREKQTIK